MTSQANEDPTPFTASPGWSTHERANEAATPTVQPPALSVLPGQATVEPAPNGPAPGRADEMRAVSFDVAALAETVTDIERARIAAENRHRSWVQAGLDDTAAAEQAGQIAAELAKVEHQATLAVQRAVRRHPLAPYVKATIGLGEKQAARLLAAIGDPYWNSLHDRPRTVSELWAYCGYHVLHPGQSPADAQSCGAGVDPSTATGQRRDDAQALLARGGDPSCSHPSQGCVDAPTMDAGVAARRRKGQRANWSNEAKMRARLCAESCIKQARSPYRPIYDASRAADTGKGLTPLHEHNRALRKVAKALLKDLWRAARDWHHETGGQP